MIKLILLDVDGTLTNGTLSLLESRSPYQSHEPRKRIEQHNTHELITINELKGFHIHDGLGIVAWRKLGREVAIISGRESKALESRAKDLGITRIYMGVQDKSRIAKQILAELHLTKENVACIGDDVNDLGMFKECGLCFAPANANTYIKTKAHITLEKNGGEGAVREMIESILQRDGAYSEFIALYE